MADKTSALPQNVAGKWYVDESCIGCGLCASTADKNFAMEGDKAYVMKQPVDSTEEADSISALDSCPVQAIGNDR
jgi:ferredoxin